MYICKSTQHCTLVCNDCSFVCGEVVVFLKQHINITCILLVNELFLFCTMSCIVIIIVSHKKQDCIV